MSAALLAATAAQAPAQTYPKPGKPGRTQSKPKGPHHTYTVCHRRGRHHCDFRKIQKAVNKARAGDTVRVKNGTYREAVTITGRKKRYVKLIGNVKHPQRVLLDGRNREDNGVMISGADHVTVRGFKARDYKANGFFAVNVTGYTLRNLIAEHPGVYGIYAFNSIGGVMADSEAYYANDGAFYIGQTPPQAKPRWTMVRNVKGHASAIGFSATNMRYVTITKSKFYNNALGIVPNALDSEKFPPPEDNVITHNEIFWNNFDFHKGAPFTVQKDGTAAMAPVGTGVLLLGGHGNRVEHNKIYGNFLAGVGAIEGILLDKDKYPDARELRNNTVRHNRFGLGGRDVNGQDIIYDGSGRGNCFENTIVSPSRGTAPLQSCPFSGQNAFSQSYQDTMIAWIGENALKGWNRHAHPKKKGYTPIVFWKAHKKSASHHKDRRRHHHQAKRKTVQVRDFYFSPDDLKVRRGTKITWEWPGADETSAVHDVKLKKGPKGVKHFHSKPAANDYRFTRRLTKPGTYRLVCTFHSNMRMRIVVRK